MQLNRTVSDPDDVLEDAEGDSGNAEEPPQPDNQTLIRLLEDNEKVGRIVLIQTIIGKF